MHGPTGLHRLAWRSLRARPLRSSLTMTGVALGVAVLFAGLATTSGIDASIERTVATTVGRADLRLAAFGEAGLTRATLDAVRGSQGVAIAAPALERRTYLGLDQLGPDDALPAPVTMLGVDAATEPRLHDPVLVAGAALEPQDDSATTISATLAREDHLQLGSHVQVQGIDAPVDLIVRGIVADGGAWPATAGRAIMVSLPVAHAVAGDVGFSRIDLLLADDASPAAVTTALEGSLQSQPYVLSSPRDMAATMRASTGEFAATTALISAVALFVGAFLIFNTLSMTVIEKLRELGLLRAAGATRGQLTSYILIQAAVTGLVGSLAGVAIGALLAMGMSAWVGTVGSVTLSGPVVRVGDVLAALAIGLAVTLAAALEPARRAGGISPVEALKARLDPRTARRARLRWLIVVFALVGVVGLLSWPRAAGDAALVRSLLVYGVLLAVVLLVPLALPLLARVGGLPFRLPLRLEERLARASVLRDRSRAALTVGALTVGLAMIVALGGVGQHARASAGAWIADVVPGDLILTSIFPRSADEGLEPLIKESPGVARTSPFAIFDLAIAGVRVDGAAMVGSALADDGRLRFVAGDRSAALAAIDAGGAVIVPTAIANRDHITVDSHLQATAADGSALDLRVAGIAERTLPGRDGEALIVGWPDAQRLGIAGADAYAVRFDPGASAAQRATLASTARTLALEPVGVERILGAVGVALDRIFSLFDALAIIAVLIAGLGILNTLTMNVLERVREIGVLRAAGMTRRQVWRSVVVEAGITGVMGALAGVAAGLAIGALMVALAGGAASVGMAVPWLAVSVSVVLGVSLAMLAAAYPARLASRLPIVRAVSYE